MYEICYIHILTLVIHRLGYFKSQKAIKKVQNSDPSLAAVLLLIRGTKIRK